VASVLLYRRFKRAVEAVENRLVYFASAEVECVNVEVRGSLEHRITPLEKAESILDFARRRRYVVYIIAEGPSAELLCDGSPVELAWERLSLKVAKALMEG